MKKEGNPVIGVALGVAGMALAVGLFVVYAVAGAQIPSPFDNLTVAAGGMLMGLSLWAFVSGVVQCLRTPEQRREAQRSERDERNRTIREKASQTSWYWTAGILVGLYVAAILLTDMNAIFLLAAAIILHSLALLVCICWWANKL